MDYVIQLYYYLDHGLMLQVYQHGSDIPIKEITLSGSEISTSLCAHLQAYADLKTQVAVFVEAENVLQADIVVPSHFSDPDIVQFILMDQAKLFPTLDEKIYFDFLEKSSQEADKEITVVACNVSLFVFLETIFNKLKLDWRYLGSKQIDGRYNLLPWREYEKRSLSRQRRRIFLLIISSVFFLFSTFFSIIFFMTQKDKKQEYYYELELKKIEKSIVDLELINDEYDQLLKFHENELRKIRLKTDLVKFLLLLESQLPEGITFVKISYKQTKLTFQGGAQSIALIKQYVNSLKQYKTVRLNFIERSNDSIFPYNFELEVMMQE